jgi:hypothetical protein
MKIRIRFFLLVALVLGWSEILLPCPVCYGDKSSAMQAGMNDAILLMLGITLFMLALIGTAFWMFWKRMKSQQRLIPSDVFVNVEGILQMNNEHGVKEWNTI